MESGRRGTWLIRGGIAIVALALGAWVGIFIAVGSARDLVDPGKSDWDPWGGGAFLPVVLLVLAGLVLIGALRRRDFPVLAVLGVWSIVAGAATGWALVALTSPTFVVRDARVTVSVGGHLYAGGDFGGACISLPDRDEIWHLWADGNLTRITMARAGEAAEPIPSIHSGDPMNLLVRTEYLVGFFYGGENPPVARKPQVVTVDAGGWTGAATFADGDVLWECIEPRTIHAWVQDMAP